MKNEKVVRLFNLYANDLYRFALSYVGIRQEAEDIVQNLFLKLISKNLVIKSEYEKAYLYKMAANMCKDYMKSAANKGLANYDDLENLIADRNAISEREESLYNSLMNLPETYRIPIYLHYYEGYTYHEIATILKLSDSAVAMRISRGKEMLKNLEV